MRRQFNLRAAAWLLGLTILFGSALAAVHGIQIVRHADSMLRQAHRALQQERPGQALRYFHDYLRYRPDDTAALASFGLTLDKFGYSYADRIQAVQIFNEVLRREPDQKEIRFRLMHCLAGLQRFAEAAQEAQMLLPEWNKKGELEHFLGFCFESLAATDRQQYETAADWFGKAIAAEPKSFDSYVHLANILQQQLNDPERAAAVMDELVRANADAHRAYLLRRQFLLQRANSDDIGQADRDLQKALALAPHDPEVLLAAADSAHGRGDMAMARSLLAQGIELNPGNELLYKAAVRLEMLTGANPAALALFAVARKELPRSWDLLLQQTSLFLDEGQLKEAERNIAEMRRLNASSSLPVYFQARLHMARQRWATATAALESLRDDTKLDAPWRAQVLVQLGFCYRHAGDLEQQLAAFRRAVDLDPQWALARYGLGETLMSLGRLKEAGRELQEATQLPQCPPAALMALTRCLLAQNLRLPTSERSWGPVEEAFKKAGQMHKDGDNLAVLQAEIQAARNDSTGARETLVAALKAFPKSLTVHIALADLSRQEGKLTSAFTQIDEAERLLGKSVTLVQARLRLLALQSGAAARQALVEIGDSLATFDADDRAALLRSLAVIWAKLGDPWTAEYCWQRLVEEQPNDLRDRLALIEILLQSGKVEQAKVQVVELRKLEGEKGAKWRYAAAALLLADPSGEGKFEQARRHLAEAIRLRKDWSRPNLLAARIDENEGKLDQAVQHYRQAFDQGERSPFMVHRLVKLLQERRSYQEAMEVLARYEEQSPLLPDLASLGADLALADGDFDRALLLSRQASPGNSRDYRDLLWLGRLHQAAAQGYHALGRTKDAAACSNKALSYFRRAVTLADHVPDTWVSLIEFLASLEPAPRDAAAIADILGRMKKSLPPPRLAVALARCYDALGQPDQAAQAFREALASSPGDFLVLNAAGEFFVREDLPDQAAPLLRQLLELGPAVPETLRNLSRRRLALILAWKDEATRTKEEADLLSSFLVRASSLPADIRARALILGRNPDQRADAIRDFRATMRHDPPSPEELFLLAKLCQADDDRAAVRALLLDLVANHPNNPQFLARHIQVLIDGGELDDAEAYLRRLERREPSSPRTAALRAKLPRGK